VADEERGAVAVDVQVAQRRGPRPFTDRPAPQRKPEWRCRNCGVGADDRHRYDGLCQTCNEYRKRTGEMRPERLWKRFGVEKLFTLEQRVALRHGIRQQLSVAQSNHDFAVESDHVKSVYKRQVEFLANLLRLL